SAKTGIGIEQVLDAIVAKIPPPKGDADAPLKAMLVDSWYDPYLGVVILVRVIDGCLRKGAQVKFMAAGTTHLVDRVGCFRPKIELLAQPADPAVRAEVIDTMSRIDPAAYRIGAEAVW